MRFILASGSQRRQDLLAQIGVVPDKIISPDVDESAVRGEEPLAYCRRIALAKLQSVTGFEDAVVLCADTTVAVGRRILGKPEDAAEAERMLRLLSGRRHRVITVVAVRSPNGVWTKDVTTRVQMKSLCKQEIRAYIASGEWQGKAGAYGIQGRAAAFVPSINGSFSAVVGLPLSETAGLLQAAGASLDGPQPS